MVQWWFCLSCSIHCKVLWTLILHVHVGLVTSRDHPMRHVIKIVIMHQLNAKLFFVRFLVKYKCHTTGPSSFQQDIIQSLAICTVIPLWQIRTTVSTFRGRGNLNVVHTSAALESVQNKNKKTLWHVESFWKHPLPVLPSLHS